MTADEIREQAAADLAEVNEVQVDSGRAIALALMTWLPEIAAQLATLNARLSGMEIERVTLIRTGAADVTYGSETKQTVERIGAPDANR